MDQTPQTPRILAPHLSNFQHRIVRVLGTVVQLRGETAVIDAGGQIDVILNRVSRRAIFLTSGTRQDKTQAGCAMSGHSPV